jgi:hypothetical protein
MRVYMMRLRVYCETTVATDNEMETIASGVEGAIQNGLDKLAAHIGGVEFVIEEED